MSVILINTFQTKSHERRSAIETGTANNTFKYFHILTFVSDNNKKIYL